MNNMSDTITKWHEMHDNDEPISYQQNAKYIFVFDYDDDNKVFRYDISDLDGSSEVVEAYLIGAGHKLKNCDWMVSKYKNVENGN